MRYDTPVYFQRLTPGAYDASTGNYAEDSVAETKRFANIQNTDVETLQLLYGGIRQGVKTISLQKPYHGIYDRIRIGERAYQVDDQTFLRFKQVLIVSEVQ